MQKQKEGAKRAAKPPEGLLALTADIVSAFVSRNPVPADQLPTILHTVYDALSQIEPPVVQARRGAKTPAVPVDRSVTRQRVTCLEDGKKFKMLKRHLSQSHNLTPEEYRAKWGLRSDYPMVAEEYAARRSVLAKELGLGGRPGRAGRRSEDDGDADEGGIDRAA